MIEKYLTKILVKRYKTSEKNLIDYKNYKYEEID
jgi:hypothetical protein